ncbi:MAG: hypothetical protein Q7S61_01440 [bacterium]|nr:hypothetical protein [bacterium]
MKFLHKLSLRIDRFFTSIFIRVEKRIRFVFSAFLLMSLMLLSTFFFFDKAWLFLPILLIACYFLTYFSILEGIEKIEWVMLFLIPILLTVGFYLFYFLFPVRWITRIPFVLVYGLSIYAVFLISNIFNVGVEKSLQLYRAAFSVNYFYHAFVSFLLFIIIFSFKLNFFFNGIFTFIIIFPLCLQLLWSVKLSKDLDRKVVYPALLIALIVSQLSVILSFVPLRGTIFSLSLTSAYYGLAGIIYHSLDQKLFKQTIREYGLVTIFVAAIALLSIQW